MSWRIAQLTASPAILHGRDVDGSTRSATFLEPTRPAVVLGRSQSLERWPTGVDIARRPSGGGAVWVTPGGQVWVDVVVPRHDRLWVDDVNRAAWWIGDAWSAALRTCGADDADSHRGAMACGPWGRAVCFAGIGAGEVTVGGRKAVGVAQRRTREYAWFQCAVPVVWDPAPLVAALGLPAAAVDDLVGAVWSLDEAGVAAERLSDAFVSALPID